MSNIYQHNESGQKSREEALRMFFNSMSQSLSLHRMIFDKDGNLKDFTFEEINPAGEKLLNLNASDLRNLTFSQVNAESSELFIRYFAKVAADQQPFTLEYYSRVQDKYLRFYIFPVDREFIATIIEDVTARTKADNLLKQTLEKYKALIETSIEGIILLNDQGTVVEWNKFIENKSGIPKEKAIGEKIWSIQFRLLAEDWKVKFPLERLEQIWMNLITTLSENETATKEGQYLDTDGKLVMTEDVLCPVVLNGEKYLLVIQRDITERSLAKKALMSSEEELRLLNSTKDKLFSIIGHDLRNPLHSIIGYSHLLGKTIETDKNEDSRLFLENIDSAANNALNLLSNLLNWARSQTDQIIFRMEPLNLRQVIKEVTEMIISSADIKNISITCNISENLELNADRNMLKSILQNLIINAIKFTKTGGKVNISAQQSIEGTEVTVSDNGSGMDQELIDSLFGNEIYQAGTGTLNKTDSGLGLVICREFIARHGGKIWAESKPGAGSDFKFTIPV